MADFLSDSIDVHGVGMPLFTWHSKGNSSQGKIGQHTCIFLCCPDANVLAKLDL
jgi:hypothetical protein